MKCPMTFNDPCYDRDEECREDCAWLLEQYDKRERYCAIAIIAASGTDVMGFCPVNDMEHDAS